jgi:NAD(P)-dependent dehydrogenase (short-subunit alcohol dehydrogenase family)
MFHPSDLPSLKGKTFIVTGGNTGIGYSSCLNLIAHGARVYMGARSSEKANTAITKIKETHPDADIHVLLLDHTSLKTVVEAAKTFSSEENQLNGLILNAGIMAVPYKLTQDGFEIQMQVNYLAHWLLTYHLLPILLSTAKRSGPGSVRVICVSSEGHQKFSFGTTKILYTLEEIEKFGNFGRYGLSKLANVIHSKVLNDRYGPNSQNARDGKGEIWTASLHPGFIDSQMNQKTKENSSWKLSWIHPVLQWFGIMRPCEEGCVASLFGGASPDFTAGMSGIYLNQKAVEKKCNPAALDVEERERLERWTANEMKVGGWI